MTSVLVDATQVRDLENGVARRLLELWPPLVKERPDLRIGFAAFGPIVPTLAARMPGVAIHEVADFAAGPAARLSKGNPRLARLRDAEGYDLLHQDGMLAADERTVACIHDLRALDPDQAPLVRRMFGAVLMTGRLRGLPAVITPTEHVRQAFIARSGALPERVHVVANGVAVRRPGAFTPADLDLEERGYLLCVGHLEERKDPLFLLEVADALQRREKSPVVVFVAARRAGDEVIAARISENPFARLIEAPDDEVLDGLYRGARVCLAPSRLEGFGMTPLEALAAGTPVVASGIPAHLEVIGDAACLPRDVDAWARRIVELDDEGVRTRALVAGAERVGRFTWAKAAARLADLIDGLGGGH